MATIALVDSGLGGLGILAQLYRRVPQGCFVYWADDAHFPYGEKDEDTLISHVVGLCERIVEGHNPDIIVLACNTVSTLLLPPLRARFSLPIVGTVPAVKPGARVSQSGLISLMATPGTIKRPYVSELIEAFATRVDVTLVGSPDLASLAEAYIRDGTVEESAILEQIAPCFVERDGRRTDTIILGCTHYPFLQRQLEALAPWPVAWLDPAPAIARQAKSVLDQLQTTSDKSNCLEIILTSDGDSSLYHRALEMAVAQLDGG